MGSSMSHLISINQPYDQLIQLISPWVAPLGYRIIHLEVQTHRQKILRIYIDHLENSLGLGIGIEDCVKVSKALDERLDQEAEVQALLPGTYELEVSSPGVDRPLRTPLDFQRFASHSVRIHVFRPLTQEEIENTSYQQKNPRQKNFSGTLLGLQNNKVMLSVTDGDPASKSQGKKSKALKNAELTTNSVEGLQVAIPLPLISKANLEPQFDFEESTKESHEL